MNSSEAPPLSRTNSLAFGFQDVITVILRIRYRTQRVSDAAAFRNSIRQMIATAANAARALGYANQTSEMALYAIVGFLDESVLNSQDPTFQEWARRPLQEEMFQGHFAGEYFFRHVDQLLQQPDSPPIADVLELHAVCLLLGYRGKFALGENGEIQNILRRIRDKMARIRGQQTLCRVTPAPAVAAADTSDPWIKRLLLITAVTAAVVLLAFIGYWVLLGASQNQVMAQAMPLHTLSATVSLVALGGTAQ